MKKRTHVCGTLITYSTFQLENINQPYIDAQMNLLVQIRASATACHRDVDFKYCDIKIIKSFFSLHFNPCHSHGTSDCSKLFFSPWKMFKSFNQLYISWQTFPTVRYQNSDISQTVLCHLRHLARDGSRCGDICLLQWMFNIMNRKRYRALDKECMFFLLSLIIIFAGWNLTTNSFKQFLYSTTHLRKRPLEL